MMRFVLQDFLSTERRVLRVCILDEKNFQNKNSFEETKKMFEEYIPDIYKKTEKLDRFKDLKL